MTIHYAIIDASGIFIEIKTDLHIQPSTCRDYKHHDTAKFLIACTPNGAISYISPLYVVSKSDVELTKTCGFIEKLEGKAGISLWLIVVLRTRINSQEYKSSLIFHHSRWETTYS